MKPCVNYFHPVSEKTDLAALERIHQRMFPGNRLAIIETDGGKLAKVAYPVGTVQPLGTTLELTAKKLIEAFASTQKGIFE